MNVLAYQITGLVRQHIYAVQEGPKSYPSAKNTVLQSVQDTVENTKSDTHKNIHDLICATRFVAPNWLKNKNIFLVPVNLVMCHCARTDRLTQP